MRMPIRTMLALAALGTAMVAAGCTSVGTQAGNPLVPANTARDTVDKLQNQVNDATTP
jgi:hypothetical protein